MRNIFDVSIFEEYHEWDQCWIISWNGIKIWEILWCFNVWYISWSEINVWIFSWNEIETYFMTHFHWKPKTCIMKYNVIQDLMQKWMYMYSCICAELVYCRCWYVWVSTFILSVLIYMVFYVKYCNVWGNFGSWTKNKNLIFNIVVVEKSTHDFKHYDDWEIYK